MKKPIKRIMDLLGASGACSEALLELSYHKTIASAWKAARYVDLVWLLNRLSENSVYWHRTKLAAITSIMEDYLPPSEDLSRYISEVNEYITGKKPFPIDYPCELRDLKYELTTFNCSDLECWGCCNELEEAPALVKSIKAVMRCPTEKDLKQYL